MLRFRSLALRESILLVWGNLLKAFIADIVAFVTFTTGVPVLLRLFSYNHSRVISEPCSVFFFRERWRGATKQCRFILTSFIINFDWVCASACSPFILSVRSLDLHNHIMFLRAIFLKGSFGAFTTWVLLLLKTLLFNHGRLTSQPGSGLSERDKEEILLDNLEL